MKYFTSATIFKHSWDQVSSAFWQKYPGPHSKHVLCEDVVTRHVTADCKLHSTRLLIKTNRMPRWGGYVFGANSRFVSIIEESVVDPKTRTLTTYTRNIGFTNFMVLFEKCVYRPSAENQDWTRLERHVWVDSHFYGFSRALMAFGVERYRANMAKSNKGLQHVLDRLTSAPALTEKGGSAPSDTLPGEVTKLRDSAAARAKGMAARAGGVVQ